MKPSVRWLYPVAFVCLLLSGIAGLVYQVAWTRYLALFLGHTSYAVVAVLVAFMGGLALGNAWLGRYADRLARPLAGYALLEVLIAVYAFLFPWYFEFCQQAYVGLARALSTGSPLLPALKFVFGLAAILVPTTLMGGTLPILTKLVTRSLGELRARVAGLYFVNSAGAVLGVLIAEFWWIPTLGLDASVFAAAGLNAFVGAVALVAGNRLEESVDGPRPLRTESAGRPEEASEETYSPSELRLALAAAGVSGFVAMLYEIVWTRVLALVLGSSTHAFAIMLVTFIAGIATGAWWVGRWRRLRRTFDAFGWAELALAVTLLVSMFGYHLLPFAFLKLGSLIARTAENHALYQGIQFLLCFAVMFVPALCLGMTLPLASRVATSELARTGRSVGLVFSVNTVGTVLGAALGGLVLLPTLGLARAFAVGVGLNLWIALAVLTRRSRTGSRAVLVGLPIVVVGLVGFVGSTLGPTWDRAFSLGLWRMTHPPTTWSAYLDLVRRNDVRFCRDGAGSTVTVTGWTNPANGKVELALRVNGKADATSRGDLSTQVLLAQIPLLLKPEASRVLVVGVGSGITCASALTHPSVREVEAVEISPEVVEAARTHFAPFNRGALDDARLRVVMDDAKSYLKTTDTTYDVIISEPSNPWMAGVAGVFSAEFYETCRASLAPGGLMVQWVHIYESDDRSLHTVLATFRALFPFVSVWQTLPGDLVLVGSTEMPRHDLAAMKRAFDQPGVTEDLQRIDLYRLPVLLSLQLLSDFNGPFVAPTETPVHGDFHPILEYLAERAFFVRGEAGLPNLYNETGWARPSTLLGEYLREHPLDVTDAQSFALFHTSFRLPHPRIVRSILERWRELAPDSTLAAEYSAKMDFPLPVAELEARRMAGVRDRMMTHAAEELEPLRIYSRHLMHAYRYQRSAFYRPPTEELTAVLERLIEVDDTHHPSHRLRLAELAWDRGDDARFVELASEAFVIKSEVPPVRRFDLDYQAPGHVLFLLIETLWRARQFADAREWCRAAREGGYLDTQGRHYSPLLAMVVRKVEASTAEAAR